MSNTYQGKQPIPKHWLNQDTGLPRFKTGVRKRAVVRPKTFNGVNVITKNDRPWQAIRPSSTEGVSILGEWATWAEAYEQASQFSRLVLSLLMAKERLRLQADSTWKGLEWLVGGYNA